MPSIYDLKPKFQNLLRPLNSKLADKGITANHITILAMIISFIAGGFIVLFPENHWPLLMVPVVLFVRMALNAIDGMLAREHDMKSSLGAILNELGDVLSDVALYLPLALVAGVNASWLVLVVILSVVSEMAGVVAIQIGAERRYDGPMGKSDRAFLFGVIALVLGLGFNPAPWLTYLLIIMFALLSLTIFNRARGALEEIA
ncbi:MAG: CDP-alcohol phosphatidyltransferase family protein [Methylophagaceae bacterium]